MLPFFCINFGLIPPPSGPPKKNLKKKAFATYYLTMIFLANFFCRIWIFSDTPVFDLRNIFWAGGWQNQWKKWKYHKKTTLFTSIFSTKNIFEKKNFCYLIFEYDFLGKFFLQNLNFFRYPHFLDLIFFFWAGGWKNKRKKYMVLLKTTTSSTTK